MDGWMDGWMDFSPRSKTTLDRWDRGSDVGDRRHGEASNGEEKHTSGHNGGRSSITASQTTASNDARSTARGNNNKDAIDSARLCPTTNEQDRRPPTETHTKKHNNTTTHGFEQNGPEFPSKSGI